MKNNMKPSLEYILQLEYGLKCFSIKNLCQGMSKIF